MNRQLSFRVISFVTALFAALSLAGCGGGKEKASRDPKAVEKAVEEMAVDYGTYGAEAEDRIDELLKKLSAVLEL